MCFPIIYTVSTMVFILLLFTSYILNDWKDILHLNQSQTSLFTSVFPEKPEVVVNKRVSPSTMYFGEGH